MSCGLLLASTSIVLLLWLFQLAIHSSACLGSLTAESRGRDWTQLDAFPSPLLAWAVRDCTHAGLIVLLGPSMTCLLPVYTPFLLWQHRRVDSWDSASHCDTPWLAPPYVLFPRMTGSVRSALPQWVCLLFFYQNDSHGFVLHPVELQRVRLWQGCETQTIVNDAEYHTRYSRNRWCCTMPFAAMAFNADSPFFFAPEFCWFDLSLVRQHSVEVDPEVSETVHAFFDFSDEGDSWHFLSYCFVVEGAPQGLRLAWINFGICLLAPMWHLFQLLLDSGDCCVDVTGCFVDKPVVRKRKHPA